MLMYDDAGLEELKSLCLKAVYQTVSDNRVSRGASSLSEDSHTVLANVAARQLVELLKVGGVSRADGKVFDKALRGG